MPTIVTEYFKHGAFEYSAKTPMSVIKCKDPFTMLQQN